MTDVIKIALCGRLRSGKDSVADRLWFEHGFETPKAFGSPVKYYADKIYAHTPKEFDGKQRKLYQFFGEALRQYDPSVWIRHMEFSVNMALNEKSTKGIVISDLRLPLEYEWARANGFIIVRVSAPLETRVRRAEIAGDAFDMASLGHETESYVDSFDVAYEIINDGTYEDLERKVDELVKKITEGQAVI